MAVPAPRGLKAALSRPMRNEHLCLQQVTSRMITTSFGLEITGYAQEYRADFDKAYFNNPKLKARESKNNKWRALKFNSLLPRTPAVGR